MLLAFDIRNEMLRTYFLNGQSSAPFSFIFGLFQTKTNTIFTTN